MHRPVTWRRRQADERGAVAIITAILTSLVLLVAVGIALDFGLVRTDRQVDKSAADAAALAGAESLSLIATGGNDNYPFRGVCGAIKFLQRNAPRFDGLTDTSGTWTDGSGNTKANGCTDTTVRNQLCTPAAPSSWAKYAWTGTWANRPIQVTIQSGYRIIDDATSWTEESLPAAIADNADASQGCDQLAVVIRQNRRPGFGAVARSGDLVTSVRSVARTRSGPGSDAPAMLLLKRTGCPILVTGSNGGSSFIHVKGAVSSSGATQPGSIHADTSGEGCSGNIFQGRAGNGIVAYAAPKSLTDPSPDPAKPGLITSVASANGLTGTVISDGLANVYGSTAADPAAAGAATKIAPAGRSLVTRSPIDERYLGGVTSAMSTAQSAVFGAIPTKAAATAQAVALGQPAWTFVDDCAATGTVTGTHIYVNCTANGGYKGTATLNAATIVFNGSVNPSATLSMPIAKAVYIFGATDAISIGNGATFSMNTATNLSGGSCKNDQSNDKAVMFVKDGDFKQTGGSLQLCNTTVMMLGGQPNGCLPTTWGTAPTQTPCASAMGTGQLVQTGGNVDWTAPNTKDAMTDASSTPLPTSAAAWGDVTGPEDLAFWSESAGNNASTKYTMTGGGTFHVQGVFMVPNADAFQIGGGGTQTLNNAQYVATSIALNGNTTNITMGVDPNAVVTLPEKKLVGFGLVR
jgi:Flp pilus assembly protein TadG